MPRTLKPIAEQVIVITGASSGIGLVTAKRAAAAGARVFLIARDTEALNRIVRQIRSTGGEADYDVVDVGDPHAMRMAADKASARFGRIDTWVNNAGVAIYAKLVATPFDEHERMFRTNYFGAVNGAMAAVPHLRASGGALITVASIASDMPSPVMGAYAASKHAVKAYISALRMELQAAGAGITVTLVKPSGIDTPIGHHAANHEGGEAQIPPPSYAPELVADTILACAQRPYREITVGGAGRAQALFAEHFPVLFERIAPVMAKAFTDQAKTQPGPPTLFRPAHEGAERSGEQHPRTTSIYTASALHPKTTAAIWGALALGAWAVLGRRRE